MMATRISKFIADGERALRVLVNGSMAVLVGGLLAAVIAITVMG